MSGALIDLNHASSQRVSVKDMVDLWISREKSPLRVNEPDHLSSFDVCCDVSENDMLNAQG